MKPTACLYGQAQDVVSREAARLVLALKQLFFSGRHACAQQPPFQLSWMMSPPVLSAPSAGSRAAVDQPLTHQSVAPGISLLRNCPVVPLWGSSTTASFPPKVKHPTYQPYTSCQPDTSLSWVSAMVRQRKLLEHQPILPWCNLSGTSRAFSSRTGGAAVAKQSHELKFQRKPLPTWLHILRRKRRCEHSILHLLRPLRPSW
jgi:hypothetical protein